MFMRMFSIAVMAVVSTACLSTTSWAKEVNLCTNSKGFEFIQGAIPANPQDEAVIIPDDKGTDAADFPRLAWDDLDQIGDQITARCYTNPLDKVPSTVTSSDKMRGVKSCEAKAGNLICKFL